MNFNLKAVVCIGASASGKSTWAREFVAKNPEWVIVCRDDERTKLMGGTLDWSKWNWKREKEVTAMHCSSLELAAANHQNVIVADTNLNIDHLKQLKERLRKLGYKDISYKIFDIDEAEAIRRDAARGSLAVGANVIKQQMAKFNDMKKYMK